MKDSIELTKALVPLAWPLIVAVLVWKLFPAVKAIVQSRGFSVKFAGVEVSVQDATDQLSSRVEDLQKQVLALKESAAPLTAATPGPKIAADAAEAVPKPAESRTVLWVDDKPTNNAFEIAQLETWGVRVLTSKSTEDALGILQQNPNIAAVLSDMGRVEHGLYRSQAGLQLLQAMRKSGFDQPFILFTTSQYAAQNRAAVAAAGGSGATSSPVEVLEWVREKLSLKVG